MRKDGELEILPAFPSAGRNVIPPTTRLFVGFSAAFLLRGQSRQKKHGKRSDPGELLEDICELSHQMWRDFNPFLRVYTVLSPFSILQQLLLRVGLVVIRAHPRA